ncbi:MAG: histone deacetylase [Steroidobacteraceae bacterium]
MKCVFHPDYRVHLPSGHPYPMGKYPLLRQLLLEEGLIGEQDFLEPEVLGREALARVHTAEYLDQLETSTLSAADIRRLGIPWSDTLWRRSRLTSAGTLLAAREALKGGLAANLAGGTHHAFPDHGEGFCVLNDAAIAIRALQSESRIARAAIIDLDVHQGNGTAAIFANDPRVFTFSMHGARNYPSRKMRSSLDVELANGAGVDVMAGDRYGRLACTCTCSVRPSNSNVRHEIAPSRKTQTVAGGRTAAELGYSRARIHSRAGEFPA